MKKLFRSEKEKIIAGVCGGVAENLDVDPLLVRLIWAATAIGGVGILMYLIAWFFIPRRSTV